MARRKTTHHRIGRPTRAIVFVHDSPGSPTGKLTERVRQACLQLERGKLYSTRFLAEQLGWDNPHRMYMVAASNALNDVQVRQRNRTWYGHPDTVQKFLRRQST